MPSSVHYTCYMLNNKDKFFGIETNKILFHDGMENDGKIIVVNTDFNNILKNNVCFVLIFEKV